MERYGVKVLDKSYENYATEFKEKAIKRVLFAHESVRRVSLELGLSNGGQIHNWIRKYKEDGYNVINHKKGRPTHEEQRQADRGASKADKRPKTEELKTYCRERVCKKIERLSLPKS